MKLNIKNKYSYDLNKIVGFDIEEKNNIYILDNDIISQIDKKEIKSEYLFSSYIPNKNIITHEFQLQKNLLDKIELNEYIETKCYEEVGLDETEEYIFKYKINDNDIDKKFLTINVIIVLKKDIISLYEYIIKDYGYIDYITYSGLAYKILYLEKILEPKNDLYVFFTKEEILITLYNEGNYLQTSIILEGLDNIYNELIETIPIKNFNFEIFMKLLTKKGLDLSNYSEKEHILFNKLSELFSNKFLLISNQLHAIIRKFSLTTIDRIFIGTYKGIIPGINEFTNMYLGVEANNLKFDNKYNPNNININQMLFLSMLYTKYVYKNQEQIDNFTIFYRPPTFFYRKSGQFISIIVSSMILSIIYPFYQIIDNYIINSKNNNLEKKLKSLQNTNSNLKKQNKTFKNLLKKKKEQQQHLIKYIKDRKTIINSIYLEKKGYIPKAYLISNITKYLSNNKVYLNNIKYSNIDIKKNISFKEEKNLLILDVYSNNNKNITNFINDIVKKEHLIVLTSGYNKINNFYMSKIKIKVEDK